MKVLGRHAESFACMMVKKQLHDRSSRSELRELAERNLLEKKREFEELRT
jgi:hypothetical protein